MLQVHDKICGVNPKEGRPTTFLGGEEAQNDILTIAGLSQIPMFSLVC